MKIKIGDRVEATMNGEIWFKGFYKEESDIFVPYGVFVDDFNEIRYFLDIKKEVKCGYTP